MNIVLPDLKREEIPALTLGCFRATRRGLIVEGDPTLEECGAYVQALIAVGGVTPILIGDCLNHMERRYGETYVQAVELYPNHTLPTLQNYSSITGRVPISHRLEDSTISDLREVAYQEVPMDEQKTWLMKAKDNGWGRTELHDAIRAVYEPDYDPFLAKLVRLVTAINNLSLLAEDDEDIEALLIARDVVRDRVDARKEE